MPKHRTRSEKKRAHLSRMPRIQAPIARAAAELAFTYQPSSPRNAITHNDQILSVPAHFLLSDLRKTVVLSLTFLAVIGILYTWLQGTGADWLRGLGISY